MSRLLAGVAGSFVLAAVGAVQPAHAGMFEFIDEMFTFREDQKPRVAPRRQLPPRYVTTPHYDENAAVAWSGYYTRQDLTPKDYLTGSGSKVMRPMMEPQGMGERPAPLRSNAENVIIGDPGQGIGMQMYAGEAGRGTRISNPTSNWRNGDSGSGVTSRPGDYDYPTLSSRLGSEHISSDLTRDGGAVMAGPGATVQDRRSYTSYSLADSDERYTARNAAGQVTKYRVQGGDTLSGISSQPAIYGTWKLWPLIYSANRGSIGKNPANLKRSQQLDIPRDYTDAQRRAAEKRAGRKY